jgi:hypothetical protein
MTKERQLSDYCRSYNLFYYCRKPYDATHATKCSKRPRAQANALVLNDLDVNLNEEVLQKLDMENTLNDEFGSLSLNAISGIENGKS